MSSHEKLLISVIAAVDSNHNVDLSGVRMSGRSTIAQRIAHHFRSLRRDVLIVAGKPMLRRSPLAAANMAGIQATTVLGVAEAVGGQFGRGSGLVIVDDWEHLDQETWAALIHAHQTNGTPLVAIRGVDRRAAGPYALPGVAPARSFEIPLMHTAALAILLKRRFGFTLDSRTMAQVAAYSGGSPGIAIALVGAGLEQGTLLAQGEWASLTGRSLWTESITTLVHSFLAGLTERQRRTLEQLSVIGTVPLADAVAQIGEEAIAELADIDFVHLEQTRDGVPVLSIRCALIDEYLRRQRGQLRFQMHDWGMGETPKTHQAYPMPVWGGGSESALLTSTLVHHSRAVDLASKQWTANPSLTSAIDYIETLWSTTADFDQMNRVFAESSRLPGLAASITQWDTLHFRYRALVHDDVDTPMARFEKSAAAYPSTIGFSQSAATWARILRGEDPGVEELPTTFGGLVSGTEKEVNWTRFLALVVAGRLDEARQLRPQLGEPEAMTGDQFLWAGLLALADGNVETVVKRAEDRFARARSGRAWQELPRVIHLTGLAAFSGFGSARTRAQIIEYHNLGTPAPHAHAYQGVLSVWAAATVWEGATLPVELSPASPTTLESPLPGAHPDWQRAARLATSARREEAGDVLSALGDRQWGRGHRLAAAYSYLLASIVDPQRERAKALETRVSALGAPGLDMVSGWLLSVSRGQLESAEEAITTFEEGKRQPETRGAWLLIAEQWHKRGQAKRAALARERAAQSLEAITRPTRSTVLMPAEFNAREQEVIHYLAAGLSYPEIAEVLGVSTRSVEGAGARAMKKVNVTNRADLLTAAGVVE